MLKKIILCLVLACSFAAAHLDECVVCSGHQYEFQGAMNTPKIKEEFWRTEERICEKRCFSGKAKENASPRLDAELESAGQKVVEGERPKSKAMQKLEALKKATRRLSAKREK